MMLMMMFCYLGWIDMICRLLMSMFMMSVLMMVLRIELCLLSSEVLLMIMVVMVCSLYLVLICGWVELRWVVIMMFVMLVKVLVNM